MGGYRKTGTRGEGEKGKGERTGRGKLRNMSRGLMGTAIAGEGLTVGMMGRPGRGEQ